MLSSHLHCRAFQLIAAIKHSNIAIENFAFSRVFLSLPADALSSIPFLDREQSKYFLQTKKSLRINNTLEQNIVIFYIII